VRYAALTDFERQTMFRLQGPKMVLLGLMLLAAAASTGVAQTGAQPVQAQSVCHLIFLHAL
jgi:hypothetical protein